MITTTTCHKLSFLMACHNEEKLIAKTIENLVKLPYNNYEVLIGLDGCTDKTEEIITSFNSDKIKCFKLNLREGKPAVINSIIKHATGDIIIVNDADWIFKVESAEHLKKFISFFDNPKIGGIAESFPVEWIEAKGNLGYKMVGYSSFLWINYLKEKFSKEGYVIEPSMFLTNVFRKSLFKDNSSLGDDFERTYDIMEAGYDVVVLDDISMPRMQASYDKISVKDVYKQKVRTAIARRQLKSKMSISYLPMVWYIFTRSWKHGVSIGLLISFWILLNAWATLNARLQYKDTSTKEGWTMRAER